MKLKASKREIKENSYRILSVGYCELQYMLKWCEPFSYCCGVYGWSCDNYDINNGQHQLIISTGYSPIDSQNINKNILKNKYNIIKKYEEKARKINHNNYSWDTIKKKLQKLTYNFIEEVCKNEEE